MVSGLLNHAEVPELAHILSLISGPFRCLPIYRTSTDACRSMPTQDEEHKHERNHEHEQRNSGEQRWRLVLRSFSSSHGSR